jgi:hypothetical protein
VNRFSELWRAALASWWPPIIILVAALAFSEPLRTSLPEQVSGAQALLYATLAGLSASLLGLLVAATTFIAGLPADRPLLNRLRAREGLKPSLLQRVLAVFSGSTAALGRLTLVSLLGLLIDREPQFSLDPDHLGAGAYWVWLVMMAAAPAAASVFRCTVLLRRVASVMGE